MVLSYQLLLLHSMCAVPCGCTQTTHCELEALCTVLCWVMWMCLLALIGRGCRGTYFCIKSMLIFNKWRKKKKKRHIWQGFGLLLCFESWETKHPGEPKVRSFSHLQHCQSNTLGFRCEELEEILDMTESPLSGDTQSSIYSYSTLSFWSSRSLGENWHQALRYLSS